MKRPLAFVRARRVMLDSSDVTSTCAPSTGVFASRLTTPVTMSVEDPICAHAALKAALVAREALITSNRVQRSTDVRDMWIPSRGRAGLRASL